MRYKDWLLISGSLSCGDALQSPYIQAYKCDQCKRIILDFV